MRFYTVHAPRRLGNISGAATETAIAEACAVKDGFCWPAFFLSFIWALWHRLWAVAAAIFAAEFVVGFIAGRLGLDVVTDMTISFGMALIVGWIANDLRRDHLERDGLPDLGVVVAGSGEDAVERYFNETVPRDSFGLQGTSPSIGRRPIGE